jgi:hypothetical protein
MTRSYPDKVEFIFLNRNLVAPEAYSVIFRENQVKRTSECKSTSNKSVS